MLLDISIIGIIFSKAINFSHFCRGKALMEVQCLAALGLIYVFDYLWTLFTCLMQLQSLLIVVAFFPHAGSHENIVGYHSSWFENEQLYIQMELCDHSLSINGSTHLSSEREVLEALYQVSILLWCAISIDLNTLD